MLVFTPLYASILALLFIYLSFRVIGYRRREKVELGDNADKALLRRTRVHSNFIEYTPLALVLMGFAEMTGAHAFAIHFVGGALLIGRVLHAIGMSQEPSHLTFRVFGMILTFTSLLVGAALNLWTYFM